jgi:hypothetical protein
MAESKTEEKSKESVVSSSPARLPMKHDVSISFCLNYVRLGQVESPNLIV